MKRKYFTKLGVVLILIFCVFSEIIYSNNCLTVTNYNIKTDKTDASFRAVLLSDLHNKEFGRNNHLLLEAVESLKPDIIFVAGDMVTMGDPNTETALNVYRGLAELAPTYCCVGNHERNFESRDTLYRKISETGAHLLQNSMETVSVGGGKITVGGLYGFPYYEFSSIYDPSRLFLESFIEQEKDNYSILLAHEPEFFMWKLSEKELDLMLSGHTHGGIIRLPFIGALVAPNQGVLAKNGDILPKYTKGMYHSDTANMIVTAGLSNEKIVPRLNNPPEICVININK